MSNYKTVKFKVLSDNCSAEDLLDDKTHQRIADKLYEIISANPKEGLTIGLEGEWGSGKSTVVKLLQEKLKENKLNKTFVFYIDAWEHEGDHLRRVFLETLIEKIKRWKNLSDDVIGKLNDISDRVTSKKVAKKIKHTSQATGFGKCVAFAALFVPLGASLLSVFAGRVTPKWTGFISWEFWGSVAITLAPVWVYFGQVVCNLFRDEKKKYALFKTEANVDTTYETSREEERSSVEFERYFCQILQIVSVEINSMIMVIDNLDRVNSDDALRIWSTLQAFVQNKNPIVTEGMQLCKWIIVPYAQEGLSKIWAEDDGKERELQNVNRPVSFMDKSFQLRLHVPKMVISGWKTFAKRCIHEAVPNLDDGDVGKIINVLSWTRENLTDAPSPRQIKIYINQVGLACSLHGSRVPLEAICFYVIEKYLKGLSDKQIECALRDKKISAESLPQYGNCHELASEVAAILYGVEEGKAMQILLEPIITDCLRHSKSEELVIMEEMHRDVFCDVLDFILAQTEKSFIPKYVASVQKAFAKESSEEVYNSALNTLRLNESIAIDQMQKLVHDDAIAIIELANADKNLVRKIGVAYALDLLKRYRVESSAVPDLNQKDEYIYSASEFVAKFEEISHAANETIIVPYNCFKESKIDWSKFNARELKRLAQYISEKDDADEYVAEKIQEGQPIAQWVLDLLSALTSNGMKLINKTIEAISRAFAWNDGQRRDGVYGPRHWDALLAGEFIDVQNRPVDAVKSLIVSKGFWFFRDFPNNQTMFLLAKYQGELADQELLTNGFHPSMVTNYRNAWNNKDAGRGMSIYQYASYSHEFNWLAVESAKSHRALAGSVIEAALDAKDQYLFEVERPFEFYAHALCLVDKSHLQMLTDSFISSNERLKKLAESNEEKLVAHPKACCELISSIKGQDTFPGLVMKIKSEFGGLTQEEWSAAFNTGNGLAELVSLFVENGERLELANSYSEAVTHFVSERIRSDINCEFSLEILERLYKVIKPALQKVFAAEIGSVLKEVKFGIATDSVRDFVLNALDYSEWMRTESVAVRNMSAELSKEGHVVAFGNFMTIMERCGDELPNKEEIKEVVEQPVLAMGKHSEEFVRAAGERAAKYFGIRVVNEEVESNEANENGEKHMQ